jgi:uncharacterized protein YneF (UPF0154 family)
MRTMRRSVVIAEFIFFLGFLGLAVPLKHALWSYLQLACLSIWIFLLLFHIFGLNRKAVVSYFSTKPRVSRRGLRQFVTFALAGCMIGIIIMNMPILKSNIAFPEVLVIWLPLVLAAVILGHIWLNRKPFFHYLGKKLGLTAWLFGCLLFCLGIVARVY